MKKKKRGDKKFRRFNIQIHLTNRWLYSFIALGILMIIGVGVWAATYTASGAGHPYTEISTCASNGQILKMSGGAWICASDAGIISETDPQVEAVTSGKWCVGDGSAVQCNQNAPKGDWNILTDVKVTSATNKGNFGGYASMKSWIQSYGCSGYHVCDTTELTRWFQLGNTISGISNYCWAISGATEGGASGDNNDCLSYSSSSSSSQGTIALSSNRIYISQCNLAWPVCCCK